MKSFTNQCSNWEWFAFVSHAESPRGGPGDADAAGRTTRGLHLSNPILGTIPSGAYVGPRRVFSEPTLHKRSSLPGPRYAVPGGCHSIRVKDECVAAYAASSSHCRPSCRRISDAILIATINVGLVRPKASSNCLKVALTVPSTPKRI